MHHPPKQESRKLILNKLSELGEHIGNEIGISPWFRVSQEMIEGFANITDDRQWIHLDLEKSIQFSPYGTTIAHGFLILSMSSKIARECYQINEGKMGINYGLDRVRFPHAVLSESYIRGRLTLMDFREIQGGAKYKMKVLIEIQGVEKPACVAEWIVLAYKNGS